ncbi:hypothetical protein P8605_08170 [Streptomyces sp. T-3]|nr:hypothetical protein [Streptomyces sp. T-3]
MSHWVYDFAGCSGRGGHRHTGQRQPPADGVLRQRPGLVGLVDGYVLERIDVEVRTGYYLWVASGAPSEVATAVLHAVNAGLSLRN